MATLYHRQCSICLEDFKQPKFLDCHHTFCLECLRGLENKTPGFINCPLCQREIQLPSGGVDKLITNFYIQDTTQVEDGEQNQIDLLQNSRDNQHSGSKLKQDDQLINGVKIFSERKTIKFNIVGDNQSNHYIESFCGVSIEYFLLNYNTQKWGSTKALAMNLSKKESPFVQSCHVKYDITLVNQKDKRFSTKRTGQGNLRRPYTLYVELIQLRHAYDLDFGFIANFKPETSTSPAVRTFQLDIDITVSDIKYIDFNLK